MRRKLLEFIHRLLKFDLSQYEKDLYLAITDLNSGSAYPDDGFYKTIANDSEKHNLRQCAVRYKDCMGLGLFHGFFTVNGKVYAFVEGFAGHIEKYEIDIYNIQFIDRDWG